MKKLLEYTHEEARRFFLKQESYNNIDLPKYFVFSKLLEKISQKLAGGIVSGYCGFYIDENSGKQKPTFPGDFDDVNYKFLNNKDGKYAWRPLQLIHPALYVSLVNYMTQEQHWEIITERFQTFASNPKIKCLSIPLESETKLSDKAAKISHWWLEIEQKSLELALEYEYAVHLDVTDCYGAIYTHSVVWALHSKEDAKKDKGKKKLFGSKIDDHLQWMSFGQTNGIPQGSVLMDFIAEIILGYADELLSLRLAVIGITDFQILRYRDDYRIFSSTSQSAEIISKNISEILMGLGMRLNSQKTLVTNNVITDSIKPDKIYWLRNRRYFKNLQQQLLLIHHISNRYPNSGTLSKCLNQYFNNISAYKSIKNIPILISILIDIAYKNPRTYAISSAILSKLISHIESKAEQIKILTLIINKFKKIPNTGHLEIWLQRITIKIDEELEFNELLCKKVIESSIRVWNSEWLNNDLKKLIDNESIIDVDILTKMDKVMEKNEVQLFASNSDPYL
jgi:RNA-directed DNA polymerase